MKNQLIVALSYTKTRTMFGMVGIEVDPNTRLAYVRLAKQWPRENMNAIPDDVKNIHTKVKWEQTFADQQIGQHLIRSLEKALGFQVQAITTQKNLKDPEDIELIKVMDMTEMAQLTLSLKQEHQIQFPPKNITGDMKQLIKQMEMFTEHITEAGNVSYFAPGEELDCLPKALMICLLVARMSLQQGDLPMIIKQGSPRPQTIKESEDNFLDRVFGESYGGLATHDLNSLNKKKLFARKRFDF